MRLKALYTLVNPTVDSIKRGAVIATLMAKVLGRGNEQNT